MFHCVGFCAVCFWFGVMCVDIFCMCFSGFIPYAVGLYVFYEVKGVVRMDILW